MERRFACRLEDLPPGTSMTVEGEKPLALHHTDSGQLFATGDTCTHEEWSLGTEGELEGEELVCPLHMARFDLATGRPLCLPATVALETYEVLVEGSEVFVFV